MGSEWKEIAVGEVLTLQRGYDITKKEQIDGSYPVVSSSGVKTFHNEFKVKGPGVVIGRKGTLGTVFFLGENFWPHDTSLWVKDFKGNDPKFIYYFLQTFDFQKYDVGSSNPTLNRNHVHLLDARIPPLSTQRAIAHILGSLDDKITLLRQMNETLEQMAQALFQSWFVDFDPVIDKALAAGNEIPEPLQARAERRAALGDQRKPLPAEIADLFPDAFYEHEELGWVPEGWGSGPISRIAELNPESWKSSEMPERIDYVDLANTKNGYILETTPYGFDNAPSRAKRILKVDDTIFGTVRPGNRSYSYIQTDGLTGSTGFAVLRPKERESRLFIYLSVTTDQVIEYFAHLADGGAYPAIRPNVVIDHIICLPPTSILKTFDSKVHLLFKRIGKNMGEIQTLTPLRDTLLPKLISGEVEV